VGVKIGAPNLGFAWGATKPRAGPETILRFIKHF